MEFKRSALKFLRYLDSSFPRWSIPMDLLLKRGFDKGIIEILEQNGLIEISHLNMNTLHTNKRFKIKAYTITLKGIEYLNGQEQKRTNKLLLILNILLLVIGAITILLML